MRIIKLLVITQGVSRLVGPLLETSHQVVGVLESMPRDFDGRRNGSLWIEFLRRIRAFIKNQDASLAALCKKRKIPYNYIWRKNSKEVAGWVGELKPDLIVIFSMSQLLKNEILEIPRLGVINLHSSFLPSYRGPNPDFWQYYDMEMNPGVTVHYVDAGEDTGDIIYQDRMPIQLGTRSPAQLDSLIGELGVPLVLKAIDAIAQGKAPRTPQPARSPTARARNLKPEEHVQVIDWDHWPIERVWHVLRGTELWLDAVSQPTGLMAGQRWAIHEYEKTDTQQGMPGKLGKYKKRRCIFVKGGVIYIGIKFDLKRFLLKFFYY